MTLEWQEAITVGLLRVWELPLHKVREYDNRLAIERWDNERSTWEELQAVKNQIWGPGIMAVEIYPPEIQVVNERHTRHLWRFRESALNWAVHVECTHREFVVARRDADVRRERAAHQAGQS